MSTPLTVAFVSAVLGCPPEHAPTTNPQHPRSTQLAGQRHEIARKLQQTRLSVAWDEATARDALAQLERSIGIPFLERYGDTDDWDELDPDTPITLTLHNAPALTVMEQILAQCSVYERCTWQIRGRAIEVGSWSRLSVPATHEVRLYDTADLTFEVVDFANAPGIDVQAALAQTAVGRGGGDQIISEPGEGPERSEIGPGSQNLVEAIMALIEPEIWSVHGGPARIAERGGFLVVRAPDFVHRQIGGYPAPALWRGSGQAARTSGLARAGEPGRRP